MLLPGGRASPAWEELDAFQRGEFLSLEVGWAWCKLKGHQGRPQRNKAWDLRICLLSSGWWISQPQAQQSCSALCADTYLCHAPFMVVELSELCTSVCTLQINGLWWWCFMVAQNLWWLSSLGYETRKPGRGHVISHWSGLLACGRQHLVIACWTSEEWLNRRALRKRIPNYDWEVWRGTRQTLALICLPIVGMASVGTERPEI